MIEPFRCQKFYFREEIFEELIRFKIRAKTLQNGFLGNSAKVLWQWSKILPYIWPSHDCLWEINISDHLVERMSIIFYQVGPPRPVFVFPRNENMNNQILEKALKKPIDGVKSIFLTRVFI